MLQFYCIQAPHTNDLRWVAAGTFGWQWTGQISKQRLLFPLLPYPASLPQKRKWEGERRVGGTQWCPRRRSEAGVCHDVTTRRLEDDVAVAELDAAVTNRGWHSDVSTNVSVCVETPAAMWDTGSADISKSGLSHEVSQEDFLWRERPQKEKQQRKIRELSWSFKMRMNQATNEVIQIITERSEVEKCLFSLQPQACL